MSATSEDNIRSIANRVRELRLKAGYSNYPDFAYAHDIPRASYQRLESGKSNFKIKTLLKVLDVHGLSLEEFFKDL